MPSFAQQFGINKDQAQLDFVDIDPAKDTPLFLDPYVFSASRGAWADSCNRAIVSFFETALEAIRTSNDTAGRQLLNNLSEPNETCLGVSSGNPSGRGVSGKQASDLYERLKHSRAAQTGLLSELSEAELFVVGIGADKISDITTNIVRKHLIDYTVEQCKLHGIELAGNVASGYLWDEEECRWYQDYVTLPVINRKKIILVPKASVRWKQSFSHREYYDTFVLNFLQSEHIDQNSSLVETLQNGRRRVTKKSLKERYPLDKDFLASFSQDHPGVLTRYRDHLGVPASVTDDELVAGFDETIFASALIDELRRIPLGNDAANRFHDFMKGVLEFLFYPALIYPQKEVEINDGRKRIDIVYTTNPSSGFFERRFLDKRTQASKVMVECKNYSKEMANPELDQIGGRFSRERGYLGFLIGRQFDNRDRFIARCRDTAIAGRGFILAFVDDDIVEMLTLVQQRRRSEIDRLLERRFDELLR